MFAVKRKHHCLLIDSHEFAICHRGCRPHAYRLPCKAAFSEEVPGIQYAYRGFLAFRRDDGESNLALLDIEHRITRVPLCVNCVFLWNRHISPALPDGGEK